MGDKPVQGDVVDKKPEIPRKPKKPAPPETNGTATAESNGSKRPAGEELDAVASLKRARLDDADSGLPVKKAKTSGEIATTDGDVVVVDDSSTGIIIVDDD